MNTMIRSDLFDDAKVIYDEILKINYDVEQLQTLIKVKKEEKKLLEAEIGGVFRGVRRSNQPTLFDIAGVRKEA